MTITVDENGYVSGLNILGNDGETYYDESTLDWSVFENNFFNFKMIGGILVLDEELVNVQNQKNDLARELNEIETWFDNTDYIVLKVIRGNWLDTDERYIQYKNDYLIKKNRMDEIKNILHFE